MIARLLAGLAVICASSAAFSQQNCTTQLTLTQPCAGSTVLFKAAGARCLSESIVNVGNSLAACKSANELFAGANAACAAINGCVKVFNYSFSSQPKSVEVIGNLTKVTWSHSNTSSPYCSYSPHTYNYVAVFDNTVAGSPVNSISASSSFFAASLSCPSAAVYSNAPGSSTTTYPSGCKLNSHISSSAPTYNCMIP